MTYKLTKQEREDLEKMLAADSIPDKPNPVFRTKRWREKTGIPPMADGSYGFKRPDGTDV